MGSQTRAHRRGTRAAFLAGYAATWTGFALLAFAGDTLLHHLVDAWPWLAAHTPLIGATMLVAAGAFQFSPLKERCLAACHAPHAFIARYDRAGLGPAWRLGVRHGGLSVGCCWGLMLVMFGLGVGGLGWMLALTGVMLLEVLFPRVWRIRPALGTALLLLALLWLLHPAWLPPTGVS
ncbi:MAG TPA: DUF2182 domain-containing protein, partial [Ktedonobacterales bacterium]